MQHSFPTEHVADAKSAITTIQGLVGLLLALVLGLLIGTSYGVYSQQPAEVHTLGSQILQLDLVLERYGPQADPGRELLKKSLWPRASASGAEAALNRSGRTTASRAPSCVISIGFLRASGPPTTSSVIISTRPANSRLQLVQTHYLMSRQLRSCIPKELLVSVVCWATLVFICIGASSSVNALAIAYEVLGAAAVASAIYLILEFGHPYSGLFRISPEGVDLVIAELSANKSRSS